MFAGIIAFVAVATSVALGSPCGCSGSTGLFGSGLIRSSPVMSVGISRLASALVGSSYGSSIASTPSFVSSSYTPAVSVIETAAPAPVQLVSSSYSPAVSVVETSAPASVQLVSSSSSPVVSSVGSSVVAGGLETVVPATLVAQSVPTSFAAPTFSSSFAPSISVSPVSVSSFAPSASSVVASPFVGSSCGSFPALSGGLVSSGVLRSGCVC